MESPLSLDGLPDAVLLRISHHLREWTPLLSASPSFYSALRPRLRWLNWDKICKSSVLSDEFIIDNWQYIASYPLCKYQKLSLQVIKFLWNKVDNDILCFYQKDIPIEMIDENVQEIDILYQSEFIRGLLNHRRDLPNWFLRKYAKYILPNLANFHFGEQNLEFLLENEVSLITTMHWQHIIHEITFPLDWLSKYRNEIGVEVFWAKGVPMSWVEKNASDGDWEDIVTNRSVSLKVFQKRLPNPDEIDFDFLSRNPEYLDSAVIDAYQKRWNWQYLCKWGRLSTEIMDKYISKMHPDVISRYQKLSPDFIWKHRKVLNTRNIVKYQKLDNRLIKYYLQDSELRVLVSQFQDISLELFKSNKGNFDHRILWNRSDISKNLRDALIVSV